MERMINTGVHGVIDYMSAVALVVAPWLFEFQAQTGATMLSLASGIAVTAMSICTRYEGGIIKVLPMRIHLWLDVAIGLVWIVSPWLLGAEGGARSFLIVMGIISLMAGLVTVQEPGPKSAE